MFRAIASGIFCALLFVGTASAQTCTIVPFVNGTTADANQLNSYLACLAPIANPLFTGNVGIGTAAPTTTLTVEKSTSSSTPDQVALFDDISTDAYTDIHEIARFGRTHFGGASAGVSILATGFNLNGYFASNLVTSSGLLTRDYSSRSGGYLAIQNSGAASTRSIFTFGGIDSGGTPYASLTIDTSGNVGIGTATPTQTLEVSGKVKVDSFASASATPICENAGVLSSCSSSIRYKEDVKAAAFGLDEIEQMRPVTFKWKGRDESDLGLIAEEVAKIDPLFVTYKSGQVEGVKYAQLTTVLINAVKQLKAKSDAQESEIASLRRDLATLSERHISTANRSKPELASGSN